MVHIKKESKTVLPSPMQDALEKDRNVHIVGLTQSNQIPDNKTLPSHELVSDTIFVIYLF